MTLTLALKNIGGLWGDHSFTFHKKLNMVHADNATGATSMTKGFKLFVSPVEGEDVSEFLHMKAEKGSATLSLEGASWSLSLSKIEENFLVVGNRMLDDPVLTPLIVVDAFHPLTYGRLSDTAIATFLKRVSHADVVQGEIEKQKEKVSALKNKLAKAEAESKHLADVPTSYRSLELEVRSLEAKEKTLAEDAKKHESAKVKADKKLLVIGQTIRKLEAELKEEERELSECDRSLEDLVETITAEKESASKEESIKQLREKKDLLVVEQDAVAQERSLYDLGQKLQLTVCPLCSSLANLVEDFRCDFERVPAEVRMSTYRQLEKPLYEKHESLKKLIDSLKSTLAHERQAVSTDKETLKGLSKEAKKLRSDKKRLSRSIEAKKRGLIGKRELYRKAEKISAEEETLLANYSNVLEDKRSKIKELEKLSEDLKKYHASQTDFEKAEEELQKEEKKLTELNLKYGVQLHAARRLFNETSRKIMWEVGFKDFESVEVDENFQTTIIRRGGVKQRLSLLSTSEATTVAILLSLAARKAYLPDFSFLVLDTVTTSYNPPKFKRVIEYLAEQVPYLIVTALSQKEQKGIEIVHGWPYK